jgi:hypothetical protein
LEILRIMKNITELDVYKLAEELSDLIWNDFDAWDKKSKIRLDIKSSELPTVLLQILPKDMAVLLHPTGKNFICIQEALLKKRWHGYENL